MEKIFLFGVDGLSYRQWFQLIEKGIMPNSKKLIEESYVSCMNSSLPEVSSVAWTSIVTGKNPGEHNIYGFTDLIDNSYTLAFTSAKTVKADPFWKWNKNLNHLIINVPQTYPASELSGIQVSGYVALDLKRSVFPEDKLDFFEKQRYKIDVDMSLAKESKDIFFQELNDVLDIRTNTLMRLWDENDWHVIMFVITGSDRLSHYMWDQWEDENSQYHEDYLHFYKKVDEVLGSILEKLDKDDNFLMVSDHGFERQKYSLNINAILKNNGFLSIEEDERITYGSISPESKAFCMDPGRIYLHRTDRYPKGKVAADEVDSLTSELVDFFTSYTFNGQKIVSSFHLGNDVFHGPYSYRAPEIVLLSSPGISFSGRMKGDEIVEKTELTGKHRYDDAVFLYRGNSSMNFTDNMNVRNVLDVIKEKEILT